MKHCRAHLKTINTAQVLAKSESIVSNVTTSDDSDMFNPIAWWGLNVKKFPLLAKTAKKIYVIPASSAESETLFHC